MYRFLVIFLGLAVSVGASAANELPSESTEVFFLGVGACASPTCHGAVDGGASSRVRQREHRLWLQKDKHAKAYAALESKLGKRIAANLGIVAPEKDPSCLDCHALNVAQEKRLERFQISEGVTCEACHGGAGGRGAAGGPAVDGWIASHTNRNTSRADNLARGMYPTDDAVKRAELCLSCHFGTDRKFVSHRFMAAGHPRLSFELETFTQIQPAHYRVDDDYRARKLTARPAATWALGQMVAAREYLAALTSPTRKGSGAWPEFALYDCYSCHQPMLSGQSVTLPGAALPKLGSESLYLVGRLLSVIEPTRAPAYARELERLQQNTSLLADASSVEQLRSRIDAAITGIGSWQQIPSAEQNPDPSAQKPGLETTIRLLTALAGSHAAAPAPITYAQAEQLTMAMQAVAANFKAAGPQATRVTKVDSGVARLFESTRRDDRFDALAFQTALRQLAAKPSR